VKVCWFIFNVEIAFMKVATKFVFWGLGVFLFAGMVGCDKKHAPAIAGDSAKTEAAHTSGSLIPDENVGVSGSLVLPTGFGQRTGDLDQMLKSRVIRALVVVNRIGFFYAQGKPQGIQYEALQEFEKFVNQKEKTGKLPVRVIFLPMRPDQLEAALTHGLGDMIATGVVITPEREQRVAFSTPLVKDVPQIVVTGPALGNVSGFEAMAGKAIYVNPVSTYYANLKKVSEGLQKAGKPALDIRAADGNLNDDDLLEMVNAGLIPATATIKNRADLWAQVLPNIKPHPEMVVASGVDLAWVVRKNNPEFKQVIDEFLSTHAGGTSFGNTLLRRYVQNAKWIKNSSSPEEIAKFNSYVQYFKKYSDEYSFDYLMIEAQGYQESLLDQDKKSHVGAVGVMQVMPKLAAANPINVPDVDHADGNIHAGVKMMRHIADTYFNDPGIDPLNKTLFTFAAYNAGPNRIARLRGKAKEDGLDPNKWFGNVELEVAKNVGQETVTYVSNIYKYYVAYKLTLGQKQATTAATHSGQ
jgi:membrane-bound lytic murein transglycosylase MltF